jgi:hypothetical protein
MEQRSAAVIGRTRKAPDRQGVHGERRDGRILGTVNIVERGTVDDD